ncbi:MAG TPA: hypothetical protein VKP30_04245 [Polyangiaceae bacterium]|nr:hypothetical protein [Polyangiaceae bacterium]
MQTHRRIALGIGLLLAGHFLGCAGAPPPRPAATHPASSDDSSRPTKAGAAEQSPQQVMATAGGEAPAPMATPATAKAAAAPGAPQSRVADESIAQPTVRNERPGLATQFGEDLRRDVRHARFERESMTTPFATTTIWYNDASGAEALAAQASSRSGNRAEAELFNGGLVVGVTDEWFQVLRGFVADARTYAVGEANARYAIRIINRSDFAFEVVASVDGLDVIAGRPASFDRRGYVLAAHDTMMIEGFRTSDSSLAAFRFGKVSESYSAQMGHGERNVGVIGVAFFHERGKAPEYPTQDTRLRQDANPFPGEYAPRPPGR